MSNVSALISPKPIQLLDLQFRDVELPFVADFATGSGRHNRRQLLVLRAVVDIGGKTTVGFGETAPLEGFSTECLDDSRAVLEALFEMDAPITRRFNFSHRRDLDAAIPWACGIPSLRFGVELAILDAIARHRNLPLCDLLAQSGATPQTEVPVQKTLGAAGVATTVDAASAAVDDGFSCLKIKIGASTPSADAVRIEAVRQRCPDTAIRLDANGAFSVEQARRFIDAIRPLDIDLLEQPVPPSDTGAMARVCADSDIDIAADEACAYSCRHLLKDRSVDAVVLKPTCMGGLLPTLELIELARTRGLRVIISNLLTSAIGRRAAAHLAAALDDQTGPHGLATGSLFARDLAPADDRIDGGRLILDTGPGLGLVPGLYGQPLFAPGDRR